MRTTWAIYTFRNHLTLQATVGIANGRANGRTNGHTNGRANGRTNGRANGRYQWPLPMADA